ncbi:MAG: hypothetical protein HP491_15155 [Nitrospira sp.]|nr:hypothetical protein [Nitrospira sp.]MBH0181089.1 hypothetical protein [Nitrospira sp.]MBH0186282.1 hypothetical protein [Nitrospira sp.]
MRSSTERATQERVFSKEDIEFLSPPIRTALSKATKHQVIGFHIIHDRAVGREITGGILYVQGRLLHLTFTHYRAQHGPSALTNTSRHFAPNPTEPDKYQVNFVPEAARRSSRNEQPDVIGTPSLASLVIDYEELLTGSGLQPTLRQARPVRIDQQPVIQQQNRATLQTDETAATDDMQTATPEETRPDQEAIRENAAEVEQLKEQMHALQRRLSEIESQMLGTKKP